MKKDNTFKIFWSIIKAYKFQASLLFLIILISSLTESASVGIILPILEVIINPESNSYNYVKIVSPFISLFPENHKLAVIVGLFGFLIIVKNILFVLKIYISNRFVYHLNKKWSFEIMDKYLHAEYSFHLNEKQGVLLNNLIRESSIAAKCVHNFIDFIGNLVLLFFLFSLLMFVNWKITLVMTIFCGLLIKSVMKTSNTYSSKVGERRLSLNQQTTAIIYECLNGIRQIKIFSFESETLLRFKKKLGQWINLIIKFRVISQLPRPIVETLMVSSIIFLIVYIKYIQMISLKEIIPIIGLFVVVSQKLFPSVSQLYTAQMNINSWIPSVKTVNKLLTSSIIHKEKLDQGKILKTLDQDILFQNIDFSYNKNKPLFKNLNLRIPKDKTTAIVGPSGSGKSTIVDLLVRFHNPNNGRILINGVKLEAINLRSWRNLVGYVSQDTFLFNASVRENMLMGNPNAAEDDIIEAAQMANAAEFISEMLQGYDTILGDRGMKISGGQRQRIAVARAILRNPNVLIFDEATSSLDSETENLIYKSIKHFAGKKTIIIITHRFSTVKNADLIYVLDKGRIIESGMFEELNNEKGSLLYHSETDY